MSKTNARRMKTFRRRVYSARGLTSVSDIQPGHVYFDMFIFIQGSALVLHRLYIEIYFLSRSSYNPRAVNYDDGNECSRRRRTMYFTASGDTCSSTTSMTLFQNFVLQRRCMFTLNNSRLVSYTRLVL